MATVKKARPAPAKKVVAVKNAEKKAIAAKPTVKKAAAKPVVPAKKKVATAPVKIAATKKQTPKPVTKKSAAAPAKTVKKNASSASISSKKSASSSGVQPKKSTIKNTPVKASSPATKKTPVTKSVPVPAKKAVVISTVSTEKGKPSKGVISTKASTVTTSSTKAQKAEVDVKKAIPAKATKEVGGSKNALEKPLTENKKPEGKSAVGKKVPVPAVKEKPGKDDDKLDPLHVKAQKAMRELEETMDLSKVRPRIQATTSKPPESKPIHRITHPPLRLVEPTNTTKVKYTLEFDFRSSPKILFNALSDSSGLAGWFADEVKTKDNVYTFVWEGGESYAKLVGIKDQLLVRFQWLDDTDGTYFQFEIKEDDITSDVALILTDFANPGEKDTSIRLWESQVQKLRMLLGSL
jgi:uncharacterized protein YndB with AHSA1/START domain